MPKPIANAKPFTGELIGEYLLTLQKGTATDAAGLDQMTKLKLNVLRDYILQGVAPALHPVSQSGSTLPENPANGDYFFADTTFTVSGKTYTQGHMYTWDGVEWKDTSDIFSQYATQAQVDDLQIKVDALDGLNFKGSITEAELEQITPSAENKGWMYYVSDLGAYKASDGTAWVTVIDYVTQTVESGNTTQAPSSDAVYKMKTDLESRISANSKEISNLKQKAGTEFSVDYPSSTYGMDGVPANVAEYAKVTKLRGVTRASNQLESDWTFTDANNWAGRYCSVACSSNVATVTVTEAGTERGLMSHSNHSMRYIGGHYYLISVEINPDVNGNMGISINGSIDAPKIAVSSGTWTRISSILLPSTSVSGRVYFLNASSMSVGQQMKFRNMIIRDISVYFGGLIPSDADTIAKIQQNYPELLIPSEYGQSLVSTTHEGVRAEGINLWNQEWEWGSYSGNPGEHWTKVIPDQSWGGIRCAEPIPVKPNVTYWVGFVPQKAVYIQTMFIDDDGIVISYASAQQISYSFTVPSNCHQILIRTNGNYSTDKTYHNNIQLCYDSLDSTTKNTWHDYVEPSTISLPTPITLRSAGSVAEEFDLESGEVTRPIGSYTFTGQEAWENRGTNQAGAVVYSVDCRAFMPYLHVENVPCIFSKGEYIRTVAGVSYVLNSSITSGFYLYYVGSSVSDKYIYMVGFTPSDIQGMEANFQLDTPITEQITPILDPFVKVEPNGTIKAVQTQTPEIDSAMTAEYLSLGATA